MSQHYSGPDWGFPMGKPSFRDDGRTLTDDASDAFLAILTNRKVTEDKVGPPRSARRVPLPGVAAEWCPSFRSHGNAPKGGIADAVAI
jgi:hypothetical protein